METDEKFKTREDLLNQVARERKLFLSQHKESPEKLIAKMRYQTAERIVNSSVKRKKEIKKTLTDRIDQVVCHRFLGPVILAITIYLLYELSIVQGYNITSYTWPLLATVRNFIASILPSSGFISDPILRAMPLWVVNGVVAVMNYLPIVIILFILIAILEDTGYMARIAFILDRVFRYFGLHGQSALPLIISGLYVGG